MMRTTFVFVRRYVALPVFIAALIVGGGLFFLDPVPQANAIEPVFKAQGTVAINGYDPVAYFTEESATPGNPANSVEWNGATWHFASAANRDLFAANPEQYAPQYGGYCAYAVSRNYTATTDPDAWTIQDGKLYLNYSKGVRVLWSAARTSNIEKADANWPELLNK